MEMLSPETEMILSATDGQIRRIKRVEYELLAKEGCFDDERVELLFGVVVPMAPIDQAHSESVRIVHEALLRQLGDRANVYCQTSYAASDESMPEPDVYVTTAGSHWHAHPTRCYLVVEVSKSSLRRDRAKRALYARADVEEYWIVNQTDECVEIYRDRANGSWTLASIHRRGDKVSPRAFPDVTVAVADILPPR